MIISKKYANVKAIDARIKQQNISKQNNDKAMNWLASYAIFKNALNSKKENADLS